MVPSDWESFNVQGAKSPVMLDDWKAALDHVVEKQGVFTAVFHPHGWSGPEQWVELIDYAEKTYGKRVKFLNFREALARIEKNALGGGSLRFANGQDNGVRVLDVDGDGFMDVVSGDPGRQVTRVWQPGKQVWREYRTPCPLVLPGDENQIPMPVAFGVVRPSGAATMIQLALKPGAWTFQENGWVLDEALLKRFPSRIRRTPARLRP